MNINLYAPIGGTGYGVAGLNIYKNLYKHNNEISLFPIGSPNIDDDADIELVRAGIDNQAHFDYNAPCIKIWHQFDLAHKIGKGRYLAYPFFELNKFNDREKHHLNFPDDLIVSCNWAKQILIDNHITKPIHIVPLGVDREIFNSDKLLDNKIEDKYIFITVGKWEKRKSHDLIIELFNKAFELSDNVELWMVTFNPFLPKEVEQLWHDLVVNSKMRNKIKIFPRITSQLELAKLINYAHCGLYISRAEGWNLDLLETMSLNKPVIVTNYSAHTEFCNNTNSFLVDINELEDANDGLWFHGFGQWAKIGNSQQEQIIEYMRSCYNSRIMTNPDGVETAKIFSWQNSANILSGCIA